MLAGCTAENLLNEPTTDLTKNQQDQTTDARIVQPINFVGFGTVEIIKSDPINGCEKLIQINCDGMTFENTLGKFKTVATICTDNENERYIEGSHIFQNKGDELFFRSNKWSINAAGQLWISYEYYNGSGRFEGATGEAIVIETIIWTTPIPYKGIYSNEGNGTLSIKD